MRILGLETLTKISDLAASDLSQEQYENAVLDLVGDRTLAQRIIDWLPEAFGFILVGHMGNLTLPTTFQARDTAGDWVEIPLSKEPILAEALDLASRVFHNGPKDVFSSLALRSAVVDVVNNALNAGASLEGARLAPLAMHGLSAEIYGSMA